MAVYYYYYQFLVFLQTGSTAPEEPSGQPGEEHVPGAAEPWHVCRAGGPGREPLRAAPSRAEPPRPECHYFARAGRRPARAGPPGSTRRAAPGAPRLPSLPPSPPLPSPPPCHFLPGRPAGGTAPRAPLPAPPVRAPLRGGTVRGRRAAAIPAPLLAARCQAALPRGGLPEAGLFGTRGIERGACRGWHLVEGSVAGAAGRALTSGLESSGGNWAELSCPCSVTAMWHRCSPLT